MCTECAKRKFKFVPRPLLSCVRACVRARSRSLIPILYTHTHTFCLLLLGAFHSLGSVDMEFVVVVVVGDAVSPIAADGVYVERASTYKWFRLNGNCFDIMDQFFTLAFPFQRAQSGISSGCLAGLSRINCA